MPTCIVCGDHFPNRVRIDGKVRNLSTRRSCLSCNPFGSNRRIREDRDTAIRCSVCGSPSVANHKGSVCFTCLSRRRREMKKKKSVEFLGGRCQICGYDRCLSALSFHHRDPRKKKFSIASSYNVSWKKLEKELKKCDLLCLNCHAEVHDAS